MSSCYCIGRQRGEPFCPCEMQRRGIVNRNGRWIEPEHDYGEVKAEIPTKLTELIEGNSFQF